VRVLEKVGTGGPAGRGSAWRGGPVTGEKMGGELLANWGGVL
jgi:hypothetical protein